MTAANAPDDIVARALTTVVDELGPDVLRSPSRLRAAISDVLGPAARSERAGIDALVIAAEAGIPGELITRATHEIPEGIVRSLAERMTSLGISHDLARTTVQSLTSVVPPTVLVRDDEPRADPPAAVGARTQAASRPDPRAALGRPGRHTPPGGRRRRLLPIALTGGLMAAAALVSGGIVYANAHPSDAGASTTARPSSTPTVTITRSKTITMTRSVTKTRTHKVTISNGVTFDSSHFQAADYTMEFTPEVTDGPDCRMKARPGRSYWPCYWYVRPDSFGKRGTKIVSGKQIDGPVGRVWIQKGNVTYQVEQNGPFTVHIRVFLSNGKYHDYATLTLKVSCNKNYPCGKRLYG